MKPVEKSVAFTRLITADMLVGAKSTVRNSVSLKPGAFESGDVMKDSITVQHVSKLFPTEMFCLVTETQTVSSQSAGRYQRAVEANICWSLDRRNLDTHKPSRGLRERASSALNNPKSQQVSLAAA